MNTPASPRLICRVVRGWSALFNSGESCAPRGLGSGHVEGCEACQEFFGNCDEFDAALRADAALHRSTSEGLESRIITAVRRSQPEPRIRRSRTPVFAAVGMLAALVAVVFFVNRTPPAGPQVAGGAPNANPGEVAEVLAAAESLSTRFWGTVKPTAVALAERDPLQEELNSVYSDARGAVDFLALNFLPGTGGQAGQDSGAARQRG